MVDVGGAAAARIVAQWSLCRVPNTAGQLGCVGRGAETNAVLDDAKSAGEAVRLKGRLGGRGTTV